MSSVEIKHGEEGPKHDPYGWEEITVTRPNGVTVTIHYGLDNWVETPEGVKCRNGWNEMTGKENSGRIERIFTTYAGVSPAAAVRAHTRYRSRCRECGCRETRSVAGFPGETFEQCVECGAMVDYHFNESAII